jgi:hypothetical protein
MVGPLEVFTTGNQSQIIGLNSTSFKLFMRSFAQGQGSTFWIMYGEAISLILAGTSILTSIFSLILYARKTKYTSASQVLDNVIEFHRFLSNFPFSSLPAFEEWETTSEKKRRRLFKNNMSDYMLLQSPFEKMRERHKLILNL